MSKRRWNIDTIKQIVDGESPFIQFGYEGKKIIHKNGDSWEERGIKWTMKNGIKIRVNPQADLIRELTKRKCSKCGFDVGLLGNKLDEKMWPKTGKCFDCIQEEEMEMRCNGTYQKYEDGKILKNKLSIAKEFRENVLDTIDFLKKDDCKIDMVHEDGSMTTFVGAQNKKLLKEAELDLEKVDKLIVELEEESKKL